MKKNRLRYLILLTGAIICLSASAVLIYQQYALFQTSENLFPLKTLMGGIPVGGLTAEQAGQRLAQAYAITPVEILIKTNDEPSIIASTIHIDPISSGLRLDIGSMIQQARYEQSSTNNLGNFWLYLWNRETSAITIPLLCSVDEEKLKEHLIRELSTRYEQPATPSQPIAGDVLYQPGRPGVVLNLDEAGPRIREALCSRESRSVQLNATQIEPLPPTIDLLRPTLDALILGARFDGIIELYFHDVKSDYEFTSAFNDGVPIEPGIAFTAASTIKIPVMISAYKNMGSPLPDDLLQLMGQMIDLSDNSATDEVMQRSMDPNLAPLQVTEDMQTLGLRNTFLAGYFYQGAPLLNFFNTPANQRSDVNTDPDIYNQTSAADIGSLITAIYQCALEDTGLIRKTFSTQVTQNECREMIGLLSKNKKGVLIEAGLPEGTQMARKYGWVTDPVDGLMHSASDAALVYTPGGNFVLTVYLYHPEQLRWDPAQRLVARLATAVNNFYNQPRLP